MPLSKSAVGSVWLARNLDNGSYRVFFLGTFDMRMQLCGVYIGAPFSDRSVFRALLGYMVIEVPNKCVKDRGACPSVVGKRVQSLAFLCVVPREKL